jgi:hypothetical protein
MKLAEATPTEIVRIVAPDGQVLVVLSIDPESPSFVNTERLGEAASVFLDKVIDVGRSIGLPFVDLVTAPPA